MDTFVTHIIAFGDIADNAIGHDVSAQISLILTGLATRGIDTELLVLIDQETPRLETWVSDLERGQVRVTLVPMGDAQEGWKLFRLLYDLCVQRKTRLIHTHLPKASFYGRCAAIAARNQAIINHHHYYDTTTLQQMETIWYRLLDHFTSASIVISDVARRFLHTAIGLDLRKVYLIPYSVRVPDTLTLKETARMALGLPQDEFIIGYVGKLTRQKNITLLFDALLDMKNVSLCLAGTGEDEEYLRRRAAEMHIENIYFIHPHERSFDNLTAFDMILQPCRLEEFGLVLIEAMIRHVPVAACRIPLFNEILEHGKRGFLFDTPKDLHDFLIRSMDDAHLLEMMEVQAYHDAMRNYTHDASVEKIKQIYFRFKADSVE